MCTLSRSTYVRTYTLVSLQKTCEIPKICRQGEAKGEGEGVEEFLAEPKLKYQAKNNLTNTTWAKKI